MQVFISLCILTRSIYTECIRELPLDLATGQGSREIIIQDDMEDCESVIEIKNQDCFGQIYIELEVESRIEQLKTSVSELKTRLQVLNQLNYAFSITSNFLSDFSPDERVSESSSNSKDPVPIQPSTAAVDDLLLCVSEAREAMAAEVATQQIQLKMAYLKRAVNKVQVEEGERLNGLRGSSDASKVLDIQSNLNEATEELRAERVRIENEVEILKE
ncbi:unnamed protein product, partial [Meganyctiphanes norvegica]